ncbi:ABC transporter ATP-binding protein [Canibacter zhoujuaniae]|uniref:ABC transporter ATP-binding protein n=1 Tax=Canibacter zhoujuaniae TaxID=2708343 RepID=UPI0014203699|nr:ATP-binding cassette domain-containing protein [Canibacter zhoujuaniae]
MTVVSVKNLKVSGPQGLIVAAADFQVHAGECVALVGESGAGKSLFVRALTALAPAGIKTTADKLRVCDHDVLSLGACGRSQFLNTRIGFVNQDALSALDPLQRVGLAVSESLRLTGVRHTGEAVAKALTGAQLADARAVIRRYPHELSGGMRQRALIAAATVHTPPLIIADEPTSALDQQTATAVLATLRGYVDAGAALILITHDMTAAAQFADRAYIVKGGSVAPGNLTVQTAGGVSAPQPAHKTATLLELCDLSVRYPDAERAALSGVSFSLRAGEAVAVLGESGSGKTSLLQAVLGAVPYTGAVTKAAGVHFAWVPQDPRSSLLPEMRVETVLKEAGAVAKRRGKTAQTVDELLRAVGLPGSLARRRIRTLSGGQAQRVAIARALATGANVLLCDEPVAALDKSARMEIANLLQDLIQRLQLGIILVSHELEIVHSVAATAIVLQNGVVVAHGETPAVLAEQARQHGLE